MTLAQSNENAAAYCNSTVNNLPIQNVITALALKNIHNFHTIIYKHSPSI
jgi:hypothetical protein